MKYEVLNALGEQDPRQKFCGFKLVGILNSFQLPDEQKDFSAFSLYFCNALS
jgi:hypothetical protein